MYEEFGDEAPVPITGQRSQADLGLIDSVRMSFIGLFSNVSAERAVYEPLVQDLEPSTDDRLHVHAVRSVAFSSSAYGNSMDSACKTISTVGTHRGNRLKSFYLQNSTLGACVLNLISTTIGSGVLGLPFAMSKTGWVLGIFTLIACGTMSAFSLHLLTICATRSQPFSIQSVLKDTHKTFGILVECSQLLSCFGACLSYLVVIGELMCSLVDGFGVEHEIWTHRTIWVIIGFIIVAPPCFIETLDTLKYTSGMSLLFISFVSFILLIYSTGAEQFDPCTNHDDGDDCRGDTHVVSMSIETMRVLSIFVFASTGTQNIFNVMNELTNPVPRRVDNVIGTAIGVVVVLYLTIASCGYATYGTNVTPNVLNSSPNTIGFGFARVFTSLCVAFAFPIQFFPARNSLLSLIDTIPMCKFKDGVADSTELKLRLAIVASVLLFMILTVALLVSDLGGILSFFGLFSIVLGYIFPGASYSMMHPDPGTAPAWKRSGALGLLALGCVFFPMCLFCVLYRYNWTK